jgi:LysM repeat protein
MKQTLKKRHILHRLLLINSILLIMLLGTIIVNASDTKQPDKYYTSVMIEQHDTLWSLESQYNNGTEDRDTYINNIKQLNHMSNDTIIDGSYILLYYY